ncbi:MAG TPA: iron uptake transporter deferrochelatase/peroxidase subunit [Solirubrobacteraceae bacterium]
MDRTGDSSGISRRSALAGAAGGLLAGLAPSMPAAARAASPGAGAVPFHGRHQAGIVTAQPEALSAAAFDVTAADHGELRDLLRAWSAAAARMAEGLPSAPLSDRPERPPEDSGEALGLGPSSLTVTFGFGPTLFVKDGHDRFGLTSSKPRALAQIPPMTGDALLPAISGGDLFVQACSDDPQVSFHALRTLIRIAEGAARVRWRQFGFGRTARTSAGQQTPRNLQGFKDGTDNILLQDSDSLDRFVWLGSHDAPRWARGGTYVVTRRIRMLIEPWDRTSLTEQEQTIGRHKVSGAPFGGRHEHDPIHLARLPRGSHVRLSHPDSNGGAEILRRGYSFSEGTDASSGQLDAGLFFISFQRDPKQFSRIQSRLAAQDRLNRFITHVGSAVFLCPPGARPGGYVGETLLG